MELILKTTQNVLGLLGKKHLKETTMAEDSIMVTVRCLAFNHAKYIRQCLNGFIMQKTNFDFEVVVHDMPREAVEGYIRELRSFYNNGWKEYF